MTKTGSRKEQENDAVTNATVDAWRGGSIFQAKDLIAQETPVALVYNGISHAVMMATPQDLEDFALGFSLTEGIVTSKDEIFETGTNRSSDGIEVALTIAAERFARLKEKRRSLTGRTGCGICGAESLQQTRLQFSPLSVDYTLAHTAVDRAVRALSEHQPLQSETGAVHGAAWCDLKGSIQVICEDVGRHNALDKLIGCLARQDRLGQAGFLLISSRASYEMLQKAALAGMGIVVAVSAPTAMAIDIAERADITLVGFAREGRHVAYANSQRLT